MAKKPDLRLDSIVPIDLAVQLDEFDNGKPIGENARVPAIEENFSWKRSFVNCWTGWPNDGKSTFLLFMCLMKAIVDGWKFCIWSPEMYNSILDPKGKMITSASDLVDEIIFMKTGRSPLKHFQKMYGVKQMSREEYLRELEWVQEHFIFINPTNRKYNSLIDNFRFVFELFGTQGFVVDPFKNVDHSDSGGRFDLYLDQLFADTKVFSLETNTSFNFVAHPRNDKDPKETDGSYKVCTQFMLAGGAAWNNSMDGIYSIYRPWKHKNPQDPRAQFFTLKQRKQQLVGRVGVYDKIEFKFETNRFYFDGHCPIDGSYWEPIYVKQDREKRTLKEKAAEGATKKKEEKAKTNGAAPQIAFSETNIDLGLDEDEPII